MPTPDRETLRQSLIDALLAASNQPLPPDVPVTPLTLAERDVDVVMELIDARDAETRDLIRRLAFVLDMSIDHPSRGFVAAYDSDIRVPQQITRQQLAEMAREAIADAFALLGLPR